MDTSVDKESPSPSASNVKTTTSASGVSLPELKRDLTLPIPDPHKRHFIIGYGSLMETAAKNKLYKNTGENIPVLVRGYRREWSLKGDLPVWPGSTFLGVVPDPSAHLYAAIFQMPPTDDVAAALHQYDQWELLYTRKEVAAKDVTILGKNRGNDNENEEETKRRGEEETYWIYVNQPQFTALPSRDFPIVQSYIDIFMSGCLEIEDEYKLTDFAKNCVITTGGWSEHWVNDRIFPRRPFIHQPKAWRIDTLLKEQVPNEYAKIKIDILGGLNN